MFIFYFNKKYNIIKQLNKNVSDTSIFNACTIYYFLK